MIAAVGRPKDAALAAAIRDYEGRAARYWPIEIAEVKGERGDAATPPATVRQRESARLAERVGGALTVVCDAAGDCMSSEKFAAWLQAARESARDVAFVIGGAFGVDDDFRNRAQLRLSLAPWTLPHELARLVLAEQLYRAGTIVRGEPYHK
jgi:23S rRNA (pseudouridine1915-N3)-methyltransferase